MYDLPRSSTRRAYVLPLADVINHLFGDPTFARFVGIRTLAVLESPRYRRLDIAHGMAISTLASPDLRLPTPPPAPAPDPADTDLPPACDPAPAGTDLPPAGDPACVRHVPDPSVPLPVSSSVWEDYAGDCEGVTDDDLPLSPAARPADEPDHHWDPSDMNPVDPDVDASAHIGTAHGETMVLLFGLFVDGVQLHNTGRSMTTVFSLKCLDLPGFLVNTDLACYTIAFVDGPKEPSNMTQLVLTILHQFKVFEPTGVADADGVSTTDRNLSRTRSGCPYTGTFITCNPHIYMHLCFKILHGCFKRLHYR